MFETSTAQVCSVQLAFTKYGSLVLILGVRVSRVSRAVISAGRREPKGFEVRRGSKWRRRRARHVIVQITGATRAVHQTAHGVACLLNIDLIKFLINQFCFNKIIVISAAFVSTL